MFTSLDVQQKKSFDKDISMLSNFHSMIQKWFISKETLPVKRIQDSIHPNDSVSQIGRRSRHTNSIFSSLASSVSSAKLKQEQKKAELIARASVLKKKQDLELQRVKIQMQEEELNLSTEIAVTEAKSKVFDRYEQQNDEQEKESELKYASKEIHKDIPVMESIKDNEINKETSNLLVSTQFKEGLNPSAPAYMPDYSRHALNSEGAAISLNNPESRSVIDRSPGQLNNMDTQVNQELILSMVRHIKKPTAEISKFDGDPLQYRRFIRQFNTKVVVNTENDDERMSYLEQFTMGEVNKIVRGFSYLPAEYGYNAALQELEDRYGDQQVIANAFIKKAINWPIIKPDNAKALDDYAIFLAECEYAIKSIEAVRILEYSENLKQLVAKLPVYYHDKWRNVVEQTKEKKKIVKFEQLVRFVKQEARKATDPVYGRDALRVESKPFVKSTTYKNTGTARFKGSFHTKATEDDVKVTERSSHVPLVEKPIHTLKAKNDSSTPPRGIAYQKPCLFCQNDQHALELCPKLTALPHQEKTEFLKTKGLCFGCLKKGHQSKECRRKAVCNICQRFHPTLCHIDDKDFQASRSIITDNVKASTSAFADLPNETDEYSGASNGICRMAIIPVKAKMKKGSKAVDTYAFLDPGSSVSFCTEALMRQIGGTGKKVNITLDTMGTPCSMQAYALNGIVICDLQLNHAIELPKIYSKNRMSVTREHIPTYDDISHWSHLQDLSVPQLDADVGLLIGNNVPDVYTPFEVRTGPRGSPHATRSRLGWILWNVVSHSQQDILKRTQNFDPHYQVNCTAISSIQESEALKNLDRLVRESMNRDFPEKLINDKREYSVEDKLFLQKVNDSMSMKNGHYQIGLPLKEEGVLLPDNQSQALQRLGSLEKKINRNDVFKEHYRDFMSTLLDKGYAEKVPENELDRQDGRVWYLPHHGVYHPRKPSKVRVVFDCSAVYEGVSLNSILLQGPDLTNSLIGVLLRFRKERYAIMGDIESMFHQVRIPKEDQDLQRFFWWPNGDTSKQPQKFKMVVHLFGAVSSPSCANAALRQTAIDNANDHDLLAVETIKNNFYVDDCLSSLETEEEAIGLINRTRAVCAEGGFNLTKWVSNSSKVLESVPMVDRAKQVKCLDLHQDSLPNERALWVYWCMDKDEFGFKITCRSQSSTRRHVLSIISSVYDPLGLAAPFLLTARLILQELCRDHVGWDEPLSGRCLQRWEVWLNELPSLENVRLPRCYKPQVFGKVVSCQIHSFSDASNVGYGTASYIRQRDDNGNIHCSLLFGKSRVAPLKTVTIPRMELTAATLSVRITQMIVKELQLPVDEVFYWTDSKSVLRYIANDSSRFHTFVANRVTYIREASSINQWGYVDTKTNPADIASRGSGIKGFASQEGWFKGPSFLWDNESEWPANKSLDACLLSDDPEVKKIVSATVIDESNGLIDRLFTYFSSWSRLKSAVGWILVAKKNLQEMVNKRRSIKKEVAAKESDPNKQRLLVDYQMNSIRNSKLVLAKKCTKRNLSANELQNAEDAIISYVQRKHFFDEISSLKATTQLNNSKYKIKKSSSVLKLDPFLEDGRLRVGGRLRRSSMPYCAKHPILLPKSSPISLLIVRHAHQKVGHLGKTAMLSYLREQYWIIGVNSLIKRLLSSCTPSPCSS